MRFVVLSDTHGKHDELGELPTGDVLIHCGDYSMCGGLKETRLFFDWFSAQPHKHKIVVPGNHEVSLCPFRAKKWVAWRTQELVTSYKNVEILVDRAIFIDGLKIYGSPWCGGDEKVMSDWGFYLVDSVREHVFDGIPEDTDILVTHTPPFGILDKCNDENFGCRFLRKRVDEIKPVWHLFGHIHESSGVYLSDYTEFYNTAVMDEDYKVKHKVLVKDL